jgi:hypothetical protein
MLRLYCDPSFTFFFLNYKECLHKIYLCKLLSLAYLSYQVSANEHFFDGQVSGNQKSIQCQNNTVMTIRLLGRILVWRKFSSKIFSIIPSIKYEIKCIWIKIFQVRARCLHVMMVAEDDEVNVIQFPLNLHIVMVASVCRSQAAQVSQILPQVPGGKIPAPLPSSNLFFFSYPFPCPSIPLYLEEMTLLRTTSF